MKSHYPHLVSHTEVCIPVGFRYNDVLEEVSRRLAENESWRLHIGYLQEAYWELRIEINNSFSHNNNEIELVQKSLKILGNF